jgi:hypothetical protein
MVGIVHVLLLVWMIGRVFFLTRSTADNDDNEETKEEK